MLHRCIIECVCVCVCASVCRGNNIGRARLILCVANWRGPERRRKACVVCARLTHTLLPVPLMARLCAPPRAHTARFVVVVVVVPPQYAPTTIATEAPPSVFVRLSVRIYTSQQQQQRHSLRWAEERAGGLLFFLVALAA